MGPRDRKPRLIHCVDRANAIFAHAQGQPEPSTSSTPRPLSHRRVRVSPELTIAKTPTVAGRQLCVMGKRAAVRSASTPCQLRVTSFASKSRLVDRHPLYVPASAAPHVRASHYGLRLAHDSEQYDHGPKITTTDWQTRSAGDEEVTTSKPGGSMVGTTGGDTEHWLAVVSLNVLIGRAARVRADLVQPQHCVRMC